MWLFHFFEYRIYATSHFSINSYRKVTKREPPHIAPCGCIAFLRNNGSSGNSLPTTGRSNKPSLFIHYFLRYSSLLMGVNTAVEWRKCLKEGGCLFKYYSEQIITLSSAFVIFLVFYLQLMQYYQIPLLLMKEL